MAVGEGHWPVMHGIEGVRLGVANAGIKQTQRPDIVLFEINEGAAVAGVFTQNAFTAAPVQLAKHHLPRGNIRYLLINSGNANACTGEQGYQDALNCCRAVAEQGGVLESQVLPFSTGVIGQFLPVPKMVAAVPEAFSSLSVEGWSAAAQGIMTTDTRPKGASLQFEHDGEIISVTGIAKGAGMIRPNMATLLAYVATDAVVAQSVLDAIIKIAVDRSFNRITIDGDTSTNDSCMLIATGQAGLPMLTAVNGELYQKLLAAVVEVMQGLAQGVIRDGEGVTKFVTVEVAGGGNSRECLKVAYAIAHSPLVKTALYASDANWGRIVAAIGYAGITGLDASQVKVWLDDVLIVERGGRASSYTEEAGSAVVSRSEFTLRVDLGRGHARETVWTSDLSHDYVTINAEYRT